MAEVLRREQGALPKGGKEVIDRATFLPIGQYDDGSLTFAWPGFLKDAWEGALRSYLDAGNVPVPDAAPVTKWSSNLDALNAASIAPMSGVALRAAGMAPNVGRDAAMARTLEAIPEYGSFLQGLNKANMPGIVQREFADDLTWTGPAWDRRPSSPTWQENAVAGLQFDHAPSWSGALAPANDARIGSVRFSANDSRASLPVLVSNAMEQYANPETASLPYLMQSGEDRPSMSSILRRQ
jgi:hypothetical protein